MGIGEFGGTVSGGCIVEERGVCALLCYVCKTTHVLLLYIMCD
jgi:hypothetical protein